MRVVVVGGGGREQALAWSLRSSGADVVMVGATGPVGEIAAAAEAARPDLVVVGPEAPLVAGLADVLRARGVSVFGPSKAASRLEGSKAFAKAFMRVNGVPTAEHNAFDNPDDALAQVRRTGAPIVVKDSGLAAGKGVTVAESLHEAEAAVLAVFAGGSGEVVIEERLEGPELTVMLLTDGRDYRLLPLARDHKRLLDGDEGPMTGGMGAVAPVRLDDPGLLALIEGSVVRPVLAGLREGGMLYRGVLYVGLMLTATGPKVLEFNVRFGDPEAQAVLPLLASNAGDVLAAVANGELAGQSVEWEDAYATCVVMAAPGYPSAPIKGVRVRVPHELPAGVLVFHGGTAPGAAAGEYLTTGGRALSVVAVAATPAASRAAAYAAVDSIDFPGALVRQDIGA